MHASPLQDKPGHRIDAVVMRTNSPTIRLESISDGQGSRSHFLVRYLRNHGGRELFSHEIVTVPSAPELNRLSALLAATAGTAEDAAGLLALAVDEAHRPR